MLKILISDPMSDECIKILQQQGFQVDVKLKLPVEELKKELKSYDALIVRSETKVTKDIIDSTDKLRIIGRAGVGLDNVDVDAASEKGIIVMNSPSGNTISTAEHTVTMILALSRNISRANQSLREGKWDRKSYTGVELYGKVLGVVGLGRIGYEVAKRCLSFGMEVLAFDPFLSVERAKDYDVKLVDLETLFKTSDYITFHTPLTEQTNHLVNKEQIQKMKKGVRLINCARGGIIDEEALYEALKDGKVAGAALDVFEQEPPTDKKLIVLDNVVATPHLGASTKEAQLNVAIDIAKQVADALLGRGVRNAANMPSIDPESYRFIEPYIRLAEGMGAFCVQIVEGAMTDVSVEYLGEISKYEISPVSTAALKGMLAVFLKETVNYINAGIIAKQRGINFNVTKSSQTEEFTNAIKIKIRTDKDELCVIGTLFTKKDPRIVRINKFYIDVTLSNHMVYVSNDDKPGIVGQIGTIMAKNKINIGGMYFGRDKKDGDAITVLNVDTEVSDSILKEVKGANHVTSVRRVEL